MKPDTYTRSGPRRRSQFRRTLDVLLVMIRLNESTVAGVHRELIADIGLRVSQRTVYRDLLFLEEQSFLTSRRVPVASGGIGVMVFRYEPDAELSEIGELF